MDIDENKRSDDVFLSPPPFAWVGEEGKVLRECQFYGGPIDGDTMSLWLVSYVMYCSLGGRYVLDEDGVTYRWQQGNPLPPLTEWEEP